jgi:Fe-S cluster assembly protein SufD
VGDGLTGTASLLPALQAAVGGLDRPFFPAERRRQALARFAAQGFPTTGLEAWRHTDVRDAVARDFAPARLLPAEASAISRWDLSSACCRLVFVNGFFAPALSVVAGLPEGVEAGPLSARPPLALGSFLSLEDAPFAALNTALFPDGAFVRVTRGVAARGLIHLIFLSLPDAGPVLAAPRALLLLEENAQASVVETHAGGAAGLLSAAVTEIDLAPAARLSHVRRVAAVGDGFHAGRTAVRQARDSRYASHSIVVGGRLVRNDLTVLQAGPGAECALDGVVLARGRDLVDNHTLIDHASPRGSSRETYKYLVGDRARGVFNGEVVIRPGAVGTDSAQANANLLLSDQALVHTKPDLRIFADDVKAKHGATVGRLNADMLFYCRSRGLSAVEATRLLTQAFAVEVLDRVPDEALRESLLAEVGAWWAS